MKAYESTQFAMRSYYVTMYDSIYCLVVEFPKHLLILPSLL